MHIEYKVKVAFVIYCKIHRHWTLSLLNKCNPYLNTLVLSLFGGQILLCQQEKIASFVSRALCDIAKSLKSLYDTIITVL